MGTDPPTSTRSQFSVLLFTDVVGSTDMKSRHGTAVYARLLRRHNQLFEQACAGYPGHQILKHTGDGFMATFPTASEAVRMALQFQHAMRSEPWSPEALRTRVGIHAGEVALMTMVGKADVVGFAADMAARVMSLAEGGQILLTRGVFDDARQFIESHPPVDGAFPKLRWMAHGPYLFKGGAEPIEVFEAGAEGLAPLRPPPDADKARRVVPPSQAKQLGWRPARGQTIPGRGEWQLLRRVRAEPTEESWIGRHRESGEERLFRFLFDDEQTKSVREVLSVDPSEQVVDQQLEASPAFVASPSPRTSDKPQSYDADRLANLDATVRDPKQVGPYRIISTLGEGGMGVVYRAEQQHPIRREVALKLIKPGMDSKEVLARFEAERQALAMMSHPGIARVLDAGVTETGRPYFAMEFVAGERITDYCDRHQLTTMHRLGLFEQVCDAVQHAHTCGIIHRDIKPGNVLVRVGDNQKPQPVIIDFGVAKALHQKLTERTMFTERGQLVGTPEYMSPEQAEMNDLGVDARSDIYSLGVLLYELLIGALPFEPSTLRSAAYNEIQRIIREVEPPRPSTRLSSLDDQRAADIARRRKESVADLASELRDELEWIPLKAMRKDRTERYRTADQLREDVRKYLDGRPLIAGPPSAWYRLRKFIGRNRARVLLGASAGTAILAIAATAFVLITRARNQAIEARDVAVQERQRADRNLLAARSVVDEYFKGVSENQALKSDGLRSLRVQLLSLAAQYHERFIRENPAEPALGEALNDSRNRLAAAKAELGDLPAAEVIHQQLVRDRTDLVKQRPDDAEARHALGQSLINLGNVHVSQARLADAVARYEGAITELSTAAAKRPDSLPITADLAQAFHNLATTLLSAGNQSEAIAAYRRAIALRQALVDREPASTRFIAELATSQHDLGVLLIDSDREQAIGLFSAAERARAAVASRDPESTQRLVELAMTRTYLLDAEASQGDNPEMITGAARGSAAAWADLLGQAKHLGTTERQITGMGFRAYALLLAGDWPESERWSNLALGFAPNELWIRVNLAHAKLLSGQVVDAEAIYLKHAKEPLEDGTPFAVRALSDFKLLRRLYPNRTAVIDAVVAKLESAK